MAEINKVGSIIARCPDCNGGKSTFEYMHNGNQLGFTAVETESPFQRGSPVHLQYRLYRCAGCGRGGLGAVLMRNTHPKYPEDIWYLVSFFPEAKQRLPLPKDVPVGIVQEFREAELCRESGCYRAAAAMFRSVLDKVLRDNGYKTNATRDLKSQIEAAAGEGLITEARKRKAHEDVRVLGNDVLHDEWREIKEDDVAQAHHYTQRVLEDFYDDRETSLRLLQEAKRLPAQEKKIAT